MLKPFVRTLWPLMVSGLWLVNVQAGPNILIIYVDDLGYGDLGSFGHPVIETPNLDRLAAQGMSFRNYYAPSGLCSPSRAALLTGRLPYRTGIKSWIPEDSGVFLKTEETTLAEVLQQKGYQTALVGKWHLNSSLQNEREPQPKDHGFDYAFGHNAFQIPTNKNPTNVFRNGVKVENLKGYTADIYADDAIEWLNGRDQSQPFFLFLSMAEPHTSIENPPQYNAKYAAFTNGPVVPITSGGAGPPKEKLIPRGPGEYYANVSYMDHQIGRVLAYLREHKVLDDTIVVFASDNGPVTSDWINWWEVNAHGSTAGLRGRKHMLYEGGIKVPAIVRYPKQVKSGVSSNQLVVGMDWFVTLLKLVDAKVPTDRIIDGVDVSDVFAGKALPSRTVFWSLDAYLDLEHVVRRGDWKLLIDRAGEARELYDLSTDPLELFNLLSEQPTRTESLLEEFQDYSTSLNKPSIWSD